MSKELGNLQLLYLDLNDMICEVVRFDSQKKQLYWEWKKGRGSEKSVIICYSSRASHKGPRDMAAALAPHLVSQATVTPDPGFPYSWSIS